MNKEKALKNQGLEFREDMSYRGGLYFISISAYVGCIGVPYSDMDDYKILSAKKQENEK